MSSFTSAKVLATYTSVDTSSNLSLSINSQCFWNHLQRGTSGPDDVPMQAAKTASMINSSMWRRHAKNNSYFLRDCSILMHVPFKRPVFELVVSQHIACTYESICQSFNASTTTLAWEIPVPAVSLATVKSWEISLPDTRTGRRFSFCLPVNFGINFPSQWTTSGWSALKASFSFLASVVWYCCLKRRIELRLISIFFDVVA